MGSRVSALALASVVAASACTEGGYRVVVSFAPSELADGTERVEVNVADECYLERDEETPFTGPTVVLRRGSRSGGLGAHPPGRVVLQGRGVDGDGCIVATGCSTAHLEANGRGDLPLTLAQSAGAVECSGGGDGDGGVDAPSDADDEPWDPLAGCTGTFTEERWLVAAEAGGELVGYLTERDCSDPIELCVGCAPTSFSPSGRTALGLVPAPEPTHLGDSVVLIDVAAPAPTVEPVGVLGFLPTWETESAFYYVAGTADRPPCAEVGGTPEAYEIRRHDLLTGEDVAVGEPARRAREGGFPAVATSARALGVGVDISYRCSERVFALAVIDLATSTQWFVDWTAGPDDEVPIGTLPDESGFLAQRVETAPGVSRIYAVPFSSEQSVPILAAVAGSAEYSLSNGQMVGRWHACGSARRIGPACDLLCVDDAGVWSRVPLRGGDPEPVSCDVPGNDPRVMDIWQR